MLYKIKIVFTDRELRNRILFVLGALVVFRLLAAVPIPGIDTVRLSQFLSSNQFFGVLNIFSGGGLSNLSIIMMGVGPYITASIILQLLTIMIPALKALNEEGEAGKRKLTNYSRLLSVPLAALQGFGLLTLLAREGIVGDLSVMGWVTSISVIIAGSMLLMWIGELISEHGIGNGVSLLIFAGIISSLPSQVSQLLFTFDVSQLPLYLAFIVGAILIIAGVIFITEAERPVPVTYAKQVRGMKTYGGVSTYIPLRLNQAGVIPIIFALSILMFPRIIGTVLVGSSNAVIARIGTSFSSFTEASVGYTVAYFLLVFLFTYFYTAVTFDPNQMATNLQKNGAFIPGIRPGQPTAEHVAKILNRITLFGALFLGIIAILPLVLRGVTGIAGLALGGTALLIVVSVVLDLIKKIDSQISMKEY
ncbi:MAG: preprotein translocase subunit SecY [Candidatus Pacebacteria bacterium]|jgi:preprotein translocase subunit SecY|nr:preprotein translocase subunit SecY [Candidatus Paceibacterota bacterium]